jgi:hypothetical protein
MITIQVTDINLFQVSDSLAYLRERNYKQGVDFDFAYYPSRCDNFAVDTKKYTEFMFYDESLATWFMLVSNFKEVTVFKNE